MIQVDANARLHDPDCSRLGLDSGVVPGIIVIDFLDQCRCNSFERKEACVECDWHMANIANRLFRLGRHLSVLWQCWGNLIFSISLYRSRIGYPGNVIEFVYDILGEELRTGTFGYVLRRLSAFSCSRRNYRLTVSSSTAFAAYDVDITRRRAQRYPLLLKRHFVWSSCVRIRSDRSVFVATRQQQCDEEKLYSVVSFVKTKYLDIKSAGRSTDNIHEQREIDEYPQARVVFSILGLHGQNKSGSRVSTREPQQASFENTHFLKTNTVHNYETNKWNNKLNEGFRLSIFGKGTILLVINQNKNITGR